MSLPSYVSAAPFKDRESLLNKWFHSTDVTGNKIEWQGQVIEYISDTHVLVQLYAWITGAASIVKLINIDRMAKWNFYSTDSEMRYAYEYLYTRIQ